MANTYIPQQNISYHNATGGEYVYLHNVDITYIGDYIETSEGKYYVGSDPLNLKIQIIPKSELGYNPVGVEGLAGFSSRTQPMSFGFSKLFKTHKKLNPSTFQNLRKKQSINNTKNFPTPEDYERKWYIRYFVKRTNSNYEYLEIDLQTFDALENKNPDYDYNLYTPGFLKWDLSSANSWQANLNEINMKKRRGFPNLFIVFPFLHEFAETPKYEIENRYYPLNEGEPELIPSSLPPAYGLPKIAQQKCGNCLFNANGLCIKWPKDVKNEETEVTDKVPVPIRHYYWCQSWAPVGSGFPGNYAQMSSEEFQNYYNNAMNQSNNTYSNISEATPLKFPASTPNIPLDPSSGFIEMPTEPGT